MEKFMEVHKELVEVRCKIKEHEYALNLLRQKEERLEGASNFHFHELAGVRSR